MTKIIRVSPNLSPVELREIDQLVKMGYARSRTDLVRCAIREYIARRAEGRDVL